MGSKQAFLERLRKSLVEECQPQLVSPPRRPDTASQPSDFSLSGGSFSEYHVIRRIGEGGMGIVYEAVHTPLGRRVALKVLRDHLKSTEEGRARFLREIKMAGRLSHPRIVRAYDARYGENEPVSLVFELLEGADLGRILKQTSRFAVSDACEVARQVAEGLGHIQEHGLVHRDIKPSNIFLSATRDASGNITATSAKILDLGLASLTSETTEITLTTLGQVVGTIDYIAPEQIQGSNTVDIRADLYSLGCTLYHLIGGAPPFAGETGPYRKLWAHKEVVPPPLSEATPAVPKAVSDIVARLLSKDAEDRYPNPSALVDALLPFCDGSDLATLCGEFLANAPAEPYPAGDVVGHAIVTQHTGRDLRRAEQQPGDRRNKIWRWIAAACVIGVVSLAGLLASLPFVSTAKPVSVSPSELRSPEPSTLEARAVTGSASPTNSVADSHFALMLDGEDDAIITPYFYDGTTSVTFELWCTPFGTLDRRKKELISSAETAGIALGIIEDRHVKFLLHDGNYYAPIQANDCIVPGKKTHVAAVFDEISIQLFVNGAKAGPPVPVRRRHRPSPLPIHFGANPDPVLVGRDVATLRDCFRGLIHQCRITREKLYSEDFHPEENLAADDQTELLYHLDSGWGDIAIDLSGNGRDAKIAGGRWVDEREIDAEDAAPQFAWPSDIPPPAISPFGETQARKHQVDWAEHLGVPVEASVTLDNAQPMQFILIPPGEFLIGTDQRRLTELTESEPLKLTDLARKVLRAEHPQHLVTISKPFYISRFEVTNSQYAEFCRLTAYQPPWVKEVGQPGGKAATSEEPTPPAGDLPVASITWDDAMAFCGWLADKSDFSHVTLPTEAEWEFACRAGTTADWSFGEDVQSLRQYCWFSENAQGVAHQVGQLSPNPWGVYDLHGNVAEWCRDHWRQYGYTVTAQVDPFVGSVDHFRNVRGGAWSDWPVMSRSAFRGFHPGRMHSPKIGFRVIARIP